VNACISRELNIRTRSAEGESVEDIERVRIYRGPSGRISSAYSQIRARTMPIAP
jgi:hypothetical protein